MRGPRREAGPFDAPVEIDGVALSIRELPLVTPRFFEGTGDHIERMFLDDPMEKFIRSPAA